jgi:tRNA threonylcarbamoyladenosine biosynthesis protein TsaB
VENILAFEAADFGLTIALMKGGHIVGDFRSEDLYEQDAVFLPAIEDLLNQHQCAYEQLDLIATTQGPGSFTGVRVALAAAEGLSLASGKPVVAFNVFEWVANTYTSSQRTSADTVLVALESKRKDVYCQLFDREGSVLKDPATLLPQEVALYLEHKKSLCIGSGCHHLASEQNRSLLNFPDYVMPTAADLCSYAKQQVSQFGVYAFPCNPYYLKMADVTFAKP